MILRLALLALIGSLLSACGGLLLNLKSQAERPVRMPLTPLSGNPSDGFSFLVYGDIQGNYRNGHEALVEQMAKEDADLVFHPGDLSRDRGRGYARDFLPAVEPLARRIPFFPAPGNHDVDWGSPRSRTGFQTFFSRILEYAGREHDNPHLLETGVQKLWYRLKYGNALFIVLDSNLLIDEGKYRSTHSLAPYEGYRDEQLEWLQEVLEASSHDENVRTRFVFLHHSPVISWEAGGFLGFGGHPGHRRMMVEQTLSNPGTGLPHLLDLFRYYGVTAVFSGHEHYYERWREVIEESGREARSIDWVVTGLGGVKPRGSPEYDPGRIEKLLDTEYRAYLDGVKHVNPAWEARLEHMYPNMQNPLADFHHYIRVRVDREGGLFPDEGHARPGP